jgi:hypothetical protein
MDVIQGRTLSIRVCFTVLGNRPTATDLVLVSSAEYALQQIGPSARLSVRLVHVSRHGPGEVCVSQSESVTDMPAL